MEHFLIDRYFSLILKGLKIFLNPRLSLIVPVSSCSEAAALSVSRNASDPCSAVQTAAASSSSSHRVMSTHMLDIVSELKHSILLFF